jgi:hypothetical protein
MKGGKFPDRQIGRCDREYSATNTYMEANNSGIGLHRFHNVSFYHLQETSTVKQRL